MPVIAIDSPRRDGTAELECCRALEEGHVLLWPRTPFEFPEADRAFLLTQRQVGAGYHKNVAYHPHRNRVTGFVKQSAPDEARLRDVLRDYSSRVVRFMTDTFPTYARAWRVDLASFRPQEEAGRPASLHARNDLLHVDAFPTRPSRGDRILRVFTNLNPTQPRIWRTGDNFERLAERFALGSGLLDRARRGSVGQRVRRLARAAGVPVTVRSPYDEFMVRFHHFMKENDGYQRSADKETISFPPGSTWIVFTDMVSHAVLSGQYAVEQTFIVARDMLVLPDKAPISILERIAGAPMA